MRKKLQLITSLLVCMAMVLSLSGSIRLFAEESDENTLLSYDYVGTESDGFELVEEEINLQGLRTDLTHYTSPNGFEYWQAPGNRLSTSSGNGDLRQNVLNELHNKHSQYLNTGYEDGYNDTIGGSMNCEGFVERVLTNAGCQQIPMSAFHTVNGVTGRGWSNYFANSNYKMEYRTYHIAPQNTALLAQVIANDGYAEPGDIVYFWDATTSEMGTSMLATNTSPNHHIVFYVGNYFNGAPWYTMGSSKCVWQSNHTTSDGSSGNRITSVNSFVGKTPTSYATVFKLQGSTEGTMQLKKKAVVNGTEQPDGAYDLTGAIYECYATNNTAKANAATYDNVSSTLYHFATFITDSNGVGHVIYHAEHPENQINSSYTSSTVLDTVSTTDSHTKLVHVASGFYYFIKEVRAPENFELDTDIHRLYLNSTYNASYNATEMVSYDSKQEWGLKLKKSSSNLTLTNNNSCYSLSGAVYAVYEGRDSAIAADVSNYNSLSGYIGTLTTDASGNTNMINILNAQNYYVKEVIAPKGYALDDSIYTIDMTDSTKVVNGLYTLSVQDTPQMDPITIALYKKNSNGVGIADAQYTVKFYEGEYPDGVDPATLGKAANRSWVLKTDSSGQIRLEDSYKISGSDWYRNPNTNAIQFPLGTVTIQETKAPDGYLLDNTVYVRRISSNGVTEHVDTYNAPTITENAEARLQVKKTSTEPTIIDLDSSYSLAGAVYAAFQDVSSANNANKDNYSTLRGYVGAMTTDANGLSDKLTGLNPGTYYVKEVMAPDNFKLDETVYTVDLSDPLIYSDNTYIVESAEQPDIHIGTKASDIETNDNISNADTEVIIKDICSYTGLEVGKEYTVKGELMLKSTGEPLLVEGKKITAEKTFTADVSVGTVELTFPAFDASELVGESVVVFEKMYREDVEVAAHSEITDEGQTINFPEIGTQATNEEGEKDFAFTDKDTITLVDTISYKNVLLGKTYTISGVLMDKDTEKPVTNKNGIPIMASAEITPTEKNGTAEVIFTVENASEILGGKTVVVFEDMSYNGVSIAVHADIEDKDQTVDFPKLGTSMSETVSGLSVVVPRSRITLTDTVEYTNLAAGKTYILKGKLMDEETGEPFVDAQGNEILAEKEFTPTVTSGTVEVTFEFNAKLNKAYKVVAFEECWDKEEKRLVCFHCDIEDDNQTVGFPDVEIKTTAAVDGKKEVKPSKETKLVDRVSYSDLPVGYTYEVSGVIMDKTTGSELLIDGKSITSGAIFTPATENGEIQVVYTLDTTNFTNRELVVYEEISVIAYADGTPIDKELVAEHKDINDKGQTIKITSQPKTGDDTPILPVVIVMLVCAGLGIFIICCKKKRH